MIALFVAGTTKLLEIIVREYLLDLLVVNYVLDVIQETHSITRKNDKFDNPI